MKIAVVGAGLSGLVVAEKLQSVGTVEVFDKSRGAGGRMSTRYAGDYEFDHGAQYFTARSDAFRAFLQPLIDDGTVREWPATIAEYEAGSLVSATSEHATPLWVGAPRMNSIGKALARRVSVSLDTPIASATRDSAGWSLRSAGDETFGPYELLIYATPAPQTLALASASP